MGLPGKSYSKEREADYQLSLTPHNMVSLIHVIFFSPPWISIFPLYFVTHNSQSKFIVNVFVICLCIFYIMYWLQEDTVGFMEYVCVLEFQSH